MKKISFYFFLCCFLANAQNELIIDEPIEKLISGSEVIVEGEYIEKKSYFTSDKRHIYTLNKIKLFNIHKGNGIDSDYIYVITQGGAVGNKIMKVIPSLQLQEGDKGFFLVNNKELNLIDFDKNKKVFLLSKDVQGFFKYNKLNGNLTNQVYSFDSPNELRSELISQNSTNLGLFDNETYFIKDDIEKNQFINESTSISSYSPSTVVGGVGMILTINGQGFGSDVGVIAFRQVDDGGQTYTNALSSQIQLWTDTKIEVEVPSSAGSGNFYVQPVGTTSKYYGSNFTVSHGIINVTLSWSLFRDGTTQALPLVHIGGYNSQNNFQDGNYVLNFSNEFNQNSDRVGSFVNGLEEWSCLTGLNYVISENTVSNADTGEDGINKVTFTNDSSLGYLGIYKPKATCSYYNYQFFRYQSAACYINEFDIDINGAAAWDYSAHIDGSVNPFRYDSSGTFRHELGHSGGLEHVINTESLMHYSGGRGSDIDKESAEFKDAVNAKLLRDLDEHMGEGVTKLELSECYLQSLSISDLNLKSQIKYFPNPFEDYINLYNPSNEKIESLVIFDLSGKIVEEHFFDSNFERFTLETQKIQKGIYFSTLKMKSGDLKTHTLIKK